MCGCILIVCHVFRLYVNGSGDFAANFLNSVTFHYYNYASFVFAFMALLC